MFCLTSACSDCVHKGQAETEIILKAGGIIRTSHPSQAFLTDSSLLSQTVSYDTILNITCYFLSGIYYTLKCKGGLGFSPFILSLEGVTGERQTGELYLGFKALHFKELFTNYKFSIILVFLPDTEGGESSEDSSVRAKETLYVYSL